MAIKINFDSSNNPEQPTIILAKKNGDKLGQLNAKAVNISGNINDIYEISFTVYKNIDGVEERNWNDIIDFNLVYCSEWDIWFEINIETNESNETVKTVFCKKLGVAELSQIMLYNIEINTENDILREDYDKPTILYDPLNPKSSLLNRILEKAPHYSILHVDDSIKNIQRTFTFDGKSIYDAFQDIAKEIDCLFVMNSNSDKYGNIQRTISVYDMLSYCINCGYRGDFIHNCPKCGNENVINGYGEDTTIFVTSDELSNNIQLTSDFDSVKNCFKLEAGDDLMTATIINNNPNGTDYIWKFSDDMKKNMSKELSDKILEYDNKYNFYQKEFVSNLDNNKIVNYNNLVDKYSVYNKDLKKINTSIVGYSNLMLSYYNIIDMMVYLKDGLVPKIDVPKTNSSLELSKLTSANLQPVSVLDINKSSGTTINNSVLSIAKIVVDRRYRVTVLSYTYNEVNHIWSGKFKVSNYKDEKDVAENTTDITVKIDENYEKYVEQKIDKILNKEDVNDLSISSLFKKPENQFKEELKKYSLTYLEMISNSCESCINILIEQGISNQENWDNKNPNLYEKLYLKYYNMLSFIEDEIVLRENELSVILGQFNEFGDMITSGIKKDIEKIKDDIQDNLNFKKFLGDRLWIEFSSFRREDKYSNSNYISDGLNNAELFKKAQEFFEVANKEISKSSELQKSINCSLYNLLVIDKFKNFVNMFEIGNWIRVEIDEQIYKLRLIGYSINYDDIENISVQFSDVVKEKNSISDVQEILSNASSMSTSYDSVKHQAKQGEESNSQLTDWINNGLALTKTKIIDSSDNQNIVFDSHGLICREYVPMTDKYDPKQLKIINKGLYLTDDYWKTSKAGIGNFTYYNPDSKKFEEDYGVIANTLVGNLILSKKVGVYNQTGSITLGENGLVITTNERTTPEEKSKIMFLIQKNISESDGSESSFPLMYVDDNGYLVLNGSVRINSNTTGSSSTIDELSDTSKLEESLKDYFHEESKGIYNDIDNKYNEAINISNNQLNNYKAEIGQYLRYGEDGLILGSTESQFKTVIDNKGLYFKEGDATISYINNKQLHIPNAVIDNTMILGKFFMSPREDGGVSITWQGG